MALKKVSDQLGFSTGTWTPTITFGGGNTGVTYGSGTYGFYTKIGTTVIATFLLHVSNKGSSTGAALVEGLPFTARSAGSTAQAGAGAMSVGWATSIGASGTIQGKVEPGTTTMALYAATSGTSAALSNTVFSGSGLSQLMGTIVYEASS